MSSNLIEFSSHADTALRLRRSLDRWRAATEEWIEATLDLAGQLWQARQQFTGDREFGYWLVENEMDDLGKNDRAALIGMGQHLELSRRTLEDTERSSPRYVWEDVIKPKLLSLSRESTSTSTSTPELPKHDFPAEKSDEAPAESREKNVPDAPPTKALSTKSSLHGWRRAEEVAAMYLEPQTRTAIGKAIRGRGGKEIWTLFLQALDAGLLTPTNNAFRELSLRAIFPGVSVNYSHRFDLRQPKDRANLRDVILPAAAANRDAILASPQDTQAIIEGYIRRQNELKQHEEARHRTERKIKELPANEQEVVMYGQRLWPRPDGELYNYRQLRSGIWWFRDLNRWLDGTPDSQPSARALKIRHLVNWPHQFARHELSPVTCKECDDRAREKLEKLIGVVHKLSRLMESNPMSDEREWKFPPEPKSENEEW